jgi:hypothetical protein
LVHSVCDDSTEKYGTTRVSRQNRQNTPSEMGAFVTSTLELLDYDCCGESQGILGITYIANNTNYSIFAQHCTTRASRQNRKNPLSEMGAFTTSIRLQLLW